MQVIQRAEDGERLIHSQGNHRDGGALVCGGLYLRDARLRQILQAAIGPPTRSCAGMAHDRDKRVLAFEQDHASTIKLNRKGDIMKLEPFCTFDLRISFHVSGA